MVRLAIGPVKSIEERGVDQGTGPDHATGVDDETAEQATQREANQLRRENKHDLVSLANRLVVEKALRGDNIGRICAVDNYVGHNGDQDMLFDVERTRVERPGITKGVEAGRRKNTLKGFSKGQGCQLSNNACNNDGRI